MAPPNEVTSLLGHGNIHTHTHPDETASRESDSGPNHDSAIDDDDDDDDDDGDEPLNVLMSENDAPMTSLGINGAMDMLGTSFARRSSMAHISADLGSELPRRRSSQLPPPSTMAAQERRRQRMSESALHQYQRRKSSVRKMSISFATHLEDAETDEGAASFLSGDVSVAQFRWIFVALCMTWFVAAFDSTLMASSHPVITSYFNASNSAAWLSTAFLLTSTAFQPMFGRISDMYGRKSPFVFSMAVFTIGTAFCGLAQSILQFIVARAICGLGAGGAMALGVIIVSDLIPLHRRAAYLAILNTFLGTALAMGAALGGLMADTLGWRWEFGIQVPPLALCFLVSTIALPSGLGPCLSAKGSSSFSRTLREFDVVGTTLLTVSTTALMLGLNVGGNVLPWSHPAVIVSFIIFAVLGVAFIATEYHVSNPIMPLRFISRIPSTNIIFSCFFGCMTMNTVLFNVPLYFQGTLLDTPTRSGIRLIIPFVISMAAALGAGYVIQVTQKVLPCMIIGAVFILLGSVALTIMPQSLPDLSYSWIITISTVGQGINFPTYSMSLLSVTPVGDMAVAMGTLFLFRNLGNVLGVAISSLASQNALVYYLGLNVKGDGAADIINDVRKSVEVIRDLPPDIRTKVISAYASTMKITFGQGIITAALTLFLVVGIQLPKLNAAVRGKPVIAEH